MLREALHYSYSCSRSIRPCGLQLAPVRRRAERGARFRIGCIDFPHQLLELRLGFENRLAHCRGAAQIGGLTPAVVHQLRADIGKRLEIACAVDDATRCSQLGVDDAQVKYAGNGSRHEKRDHQNGELLPCLQRSKQFHEY